MQPLIDEDMPFPARCQVPVPSDDKYRLMPSANQSSRSWAQCAGASPQLSPWQGAMVHWGIMIGARYRGKLALRVMASSSEGSRRLQSGRVVYHPQWIRNTPGLIGVQGSNFPSPRLPNRAPSFSALSFSPLMSGNPGNRYY